MAKYRVRVGAISMGVWEAEDKEEALERYAKEAGYQSYEQLLDEVPGAYDDNVSVIEQEESDV